MTWVRADEKDEKLDSNDPDLKKIFVDDAEYPSELFLKESFSLNLANVERGTFSKNSISIEGYYERDGTYGDFHDFIVIKIKKGNSGENVDLCVTVSDALKIAQTIISFSGKTFHDC